MEIVPQDTGFTKEKTIRHSSFLHAPRQNLVCREFMPALPTNPTPSDLAAGPRPGVERAVMSTPARATHDSPVVFLHILAHARLLCWISSRETRFRRGGVSIGWWTPVKKGLDRRTRRRRIFDRRSALRRASLAQGQETAGENCVFGDRAGSLAFAVTA